MSDDYIKTEFHDQLVGRKIVNVRKLMKVEMDDLDWYDSYGDVPLVVFLDDGSFFIPAQDPELNGPGFLLIEPAP